MNYTSTYNEFLVGPCNSRTTSLEDRLQLLEQGPSLEVEPTISTQIFDDLTRQMSIFEKHLDSLEKRMEQYHKEFYEFQDFWFDEDKRNTVVTNSEMMQTIKLQSDLQAAKLKLIVDTLTAHKLWPPVTTPDNARETYPNFPKCGNLRALQQLPRSAEDLPQKRIPVACIRVGLQTMRPLVCCRSSIIISQGADKKSAC